MHLIGQMVNVINGENFTHSEDTTTKIDHVFVISFRESNKDRDYYLENIEEDIFDRYTKYPDISTTVTRAYLFSNKEDALKHYNAIEKGRKSFNLPSDMLVEVQKWYRITSLLNVETLTQ